MNKTDGSTMEMPNLRLERYKQTATSYKKMINDLSKKGNPEKLREIVIKKLTDTHMITFRTRFGRLAG